MINYEPTIHPTKNKQISNLNQDLALVIIREQLSLSDENIKQTLF